MHDLRGVVFLMAVRPFQTDDLICDIVYDHRLLQ